MPSSVVGGLAFRKAALNCRPWVRSLTQLPLICTHSPDAIVAACPTTVTRSRWPRALTRSTQKPLSALWNVTRSTSPASASTGGPRSAVGGEKERGRGQCGLLRRRHLVQTQPVPRGSRFEDLCGDGEHAR